jgi:hypothetical protein
VQGAPANAVLALDGRGLLQGVWVEGQDVAFAEPEEVLKAVQAFVRSN